MNEQAQKIPSALLICKGSAKDGLGHITRTLTVAKGMQKVFSVKIVVIGDMFIDNLLAGRGVDYCIISDHIGAIKIFDTVAPDIVIFDLLYLDEEIFGYIKNSVTTISLSPIFNFLDQVDYIYHRTSILSDEWPTGPGKPITKCGFEYTVINQSCRKIPEDVFKHNLDFQELSVAISMGGTDAANKTLQVLRKIKTVPRKILIWVILGEGYGHSYQDLLDSMKDSPNEIILVKTNDSLWRILSTCSIAILSGGTTTYEAVYAGLPSINLIENNQYAFLIKELLNEHVSVRVGESWEKGLEGLPFVLCDFFDHREKLLRMHQHAKTLIDGFGAERIAQDIWTNYCSSVGNSRQLDTCLQGKIAIK